MGERIANLEKDLPVLNRALRDIERLSREVVEIKKLLAGLQKQINALP